MRPLAILKEGLERVPHSVRSGRWPPKPASLSSHRFARRTALSLAMPHQASRVPLERDTGQFRREPLAVQVS